MFRLSLIFSLLVLCTTTAAVAAPNRVHYMTEENPPYNFSENGKVQGIAVDLLLALTKASGHPLTLADIELLPWARGYKNVQTKPGTCLFSMGRIPQREKKFKWVGPIAELTIGLVAAKSSNIHIKAVEELFRYRIGSIRDGAPEQLLLSAGYPVEMLERVTKPEQNIQKLARNRIDMLAFNTDSTRYTMKRMGLSPDDYQTVFTLKTAQLYYAFHKDTDDQFIKKLNQTLEALKKADDSGHSPYQEILSRYLGQTP